LATATAATTRPLAAATSGIPAIGPVVAHTDPEIRPSWAVASPAPASRSNRGVSSGRAAGPTPPETIGRERVMSGLPAGRYTIGLVSDEDEWPVVGRPVQQVHLSSMNQR